MNKLKIYLFGFIVIVAIDVGWAKSWEKTVVSTAPYLSPMAMVPAKDGQSLFIACATGKRVLRLNLASKKVDSLIVPDFPSGLALSGDGSKLIVTCAAPESQVCVVDIQKFKVEKALASGHTTLAPVVSLDGKTLYVCNQFNDSVSVIDLVGFREVMRIPVRREPVAADITKDGKYLLVANELPDGRADGPYVAAVVSVIDLAMGKVIREIQMPHGGTELKDLRISPDGKFAAVSFVLGRFYHPTTDVFRGWMNANSLAIIDIGSLSLRGTVILDEPDKGCANPWGMAWAANGKHLLVTHAGTHEVSLIDFPALIAELPQNFTGYQGDKDLNGATKSTREQAEFSNYSLPYLVGARQRIKMVPSDFGPRSVVIVGQKAYVANYFSDSLGVIDLLENSPHATSIALGSKPVMDKVREGEFHFHDGSICYQGWQSCSSCHPGDARVDGLNWDLLNDGIGNPKSTRSLLLAHKTPPAMFSGVRTNAEVAVRAGIKFILFTNQPESVAVAIDEYLKSLNPVPSPHLVHGKLSPAAKRGEKLFSKAECINCHVPGLFTDLHAHDVGTTREFDKATDKFYTPTLVEVWRTAPYLHDGSAVTIKDVLTTRNHDGQHGDVSGLSQQEIDDLCEYVLSL